MYIQYDYDNNGNITHVTAYNDILNEYALVEVFKTYYNAMFDEYRVKPQYALESF